MIKTMFERVMDIILSLLSSSQSHGHDSAMSLETLDDTALSSEPYLESLRDEYYHEGTARGEPVYTETSSGTRTYRDAMTAMTAAYFDLARLMILSAVSNTKADASMIMSCNSILACITYLKTQSIGCAYLRMMLPVAFVALKSPLASQRQAARGMLVNWKSKRILMGLCTVVLHCIDRDGAEALRCACSMTVDGTTMSV